MYAVIESGGKQYRVELGSEIEVEKLDAAPGDNIDIERVLLVADEDSSEIGRPMVEGALVSASVVRQDRGEKIVVFKYRPKARTRVKRGHRQELTVIRIADIRFAGRSAAEEAEADAKKDEQARARAEKEAARQAAADQALAAKLAADAEAEAAADKKKAAADSKKAAADAKDAGKAQAVGTADKPKARRRTKSTKATAGEGAEASATENEASATEADETPPAKSRRTKKDE